MIFFGISSISAFEVNTHQAITRCAITTECNQNGATNLHKFAEDTFFDKKSYANEKFEGIYKDEKYFEYMKTGTGFEAFFIQNKGTRYLDLIEAGVVLEDAVYPHPDNDGDGRFNNHFYAAQFNSKQVCKTIGEISGSMLGFINPRLGSLGRMTGAKLAENMLSNHALCMGYGKRTDNITWALDKNVKLETTNVNFSEHGGEDRINEHGIEDAFKYYRESFEGNPADRKKNQAKLFLSLGYMIHLIQDLHSPAHVRDGSHPFGDYLEIYGRYDGGFNLVNGNMNLDKNNPLIWDAIRNINMKQSMLDNNKYSSYQDFFKHEANWVSNNFMSESHNDTTEAENNSTGEGLDFDTSTDRDTIFDLYNKHLSELETTDIPIPNAEKDSRGNPDRWYYITRNSFIETTQEHGDINTNTRVAIIEKGYLDNSERMMAIVDGSATFNPFDTEPHYKYDSSALSDTAIHVMPRAVVSSEAFINYFFRGRMKASLEYDPMLDEEFIKITNTSDAQWVSSPDLCTFKKGMKINIYYVDKNGESKSIRTSTLLNDVVIGESTVIPMANYISSITDMGDKKQIIVLLDGQLGTKADKNDYGIDDNGARGLVVAYASSRVANADILFSFDRSGSMGSECAKKA